MTMVRLNIYDLYKIHVGFADYVVCFILIVFVG